MEQALTIAVALFAIGSAIKLGIEIIRLILLK